MSQIVSRCGNCNDETFVLWDCPCPARDCPIKTGVCKSCYRAIVRNVQREIAAAEARIEQRSRELDAAERVGTLAQAIASTPSVAEQVTHSDGIAP